MPKNIVQDVIPPKRSIRNVELPSRAGRALAEQDESKPAKASAVENRGTSKIKISKNVKAAVPVEPTPPAAPTPPAPVVPPEIIDAVHTPPPKVPPTIPAYTYEYDDARKPSRKWLYVSGVLLVIAIAFGISAFFKSAQITVTPKQQTLPVAVTLTAKKNATGSDLGFQIVTVTKDVQKTVPATGSTQVDTKATGTIVVYNSYSTAPQSLVATTRFQTSGGLVFRLVKGITIPGKTTSGGQTVAGSIEAAVVADASGDKYNIGLSDFTVPGLQGGPKYAGIYGRSKTEMTGGFSGIQKVVAKDTLLSADTALQASLRDLLSQNIATQIPANFVFYPTSVSYSFDPIIQAQSSTSTVVLEKKGTISGIIFDKSALVQSVFTKENSSITSDVATITNLDSLNFAYATGTASATVNANTSSLGFSLSGNASVVWMFDQNKLKTDLLGLSKNSANTVIATYPGIQEAWVVTKPFWNQNIPTDPKKVTLINTITVDGGQNGI